MISVENLPAQVSNLKILIRLPNWLGDLVMSTAFVHAVRQAYPEALIDIILKKEFDGIAALIPGINNVHLFSKQEFSGLAGIFQFGKTLRKHQYDIYFNLPHSLSSFIMAYASGAKQRVGFKQEGGLFLLTNAIRKPAGMHRVDEYLVLLEHFTGKPVTDRVVMLNAPVSRDADTVVINFNSEASSRRMPLNKGRSIINALTEFFPASTFTIVGSPKETDFLNELLSGLANSQNVQNLAGKTDLESLVQLLAGSKVVLTTDSGPAHLANALGIPTVVLFGAGDENNTAPYNKSNLRIIRYGRLECEPCVRNTCKLYGIPKCMELLDALEIINALNLHLNDA